MKGPCSAPRPTVQLSPCEGPLKAKSLGPHFTQPGTPRTQICLWPREASRGQGLGAEPLLSSALCGYDRALHVLCPLPSHPVPVCGPSFVDCAPWLGVGLLLPKAGGLGTLETDKPMPSDSPETNPCRKATASCPQSHGPATAALAVGPRGQGRREGPGFSSQTVAGARLLGKSTDPQPRCSSQSWKP